MIMGFDNDVCHRPASGGADAFSSVVREFRTMLFRYVEGRLLCAADADDVVQEVLIIAYNRLRVFDASRDLGAWLRGIARNRVMKHNARIKRRTHVFEQLGYALATAAPRVDEMNAGEREERQLAAVRQLLGDMPVRMQTVLNGWLARRRAMEMAAELNLSVANVHQIQHRAIKLMRVGLEKAMEQS